MEQVTADGLPPTVRWKEWTLYLGVTTGSQDHINRPDRASRGSCVGATPPANKILKQPSQQRHCLFSLLPPGRRFCNLRTRAERIRNSFFPQAIRLLISEQQVETLYCTVLTSSHKSSFCLSLRPFAFQLSGHSEHERPNSRQRTPSQHSRKSSQGRQ